MDSDFTLYCRSVKSLSIPLYLTNSIQSIIIQYSKIIKPELELIDRNHVDVIAGNGGQKGYQKRQDSCDDIMYFCYRAVDAYYEDSFIDLGAFYHER